MIRTIRWSTWALLLAAFGGALALTGGAYRMAALRHAAETEFAAPDPNFGLRLPRDLGVHPRYRYEWQRLAGLVKDDDKRSFAFLFRWDRLGPTWSERLFGRLLGRAQPARLTASLLCTDLTENQVVVARRETKTAGALVGENGAIDVRAEEWRFWQQPPQWRLEAAAPPVGVKLTGTPEKGAALYGENGYCWRGPDAAPTYFLGQPRIAFEGELTWRGQPRRVNGSGFWEYEFTSYSPPPGAIGWDRFTLALNNNHELNFLRARRRDGQPSAGAPLALALPDGGTVVLGPADYDLQPTRYWTSKTTGAKYPVAWSLRLEPYRAEMHILAYNREMEIERPPTPGRIWEGPCRVEGQWSGAPVRGVAFVELTGYSAPRFHWRRAE